MKLSWACILPLVPFPVAAELAAGLGFEGVDLIMVGSVTSVTVDDVRRDPTGSGRMIADAVRSRHLELTDVCAINSATDNAAMAPNNPDPREVEAGRAFFEEMLEFVAGLGAGGLTMLPGIEWQGMSHDEALSRAAEELGQRAATARDRGIRFSVEPHAGSVCITPHDAVRLCEMAPGLELTVDYSHYVAQGRRESEIEQMLAFARHVHVRNSRAGQMQCTNAESSVNWEQMIDCLDANGYDGWVAVEHVWAEHTPGLNGIDVLSEAILLRDRLREKLARGREVGTAGA